MSNLNQIIESAQQATNTVFAMLEEAETHLSGRVSFHVNGDGFFADKSLVQAALRRAREAIQEAEAAIAGTEFPSNEDYDAFRASHR